MRGRATARPRPILVPQHTSPVPGIPHGDTAHRARRELRVAPHPVDNDVGWRFLPCGSTGTRSLGSDEGTIYFHNTAAIANPIPAGLTDFLQ